MKSALDVLAERVGIESEFDDALGETHQTPPEKKKALLGALGLATGDDAATQAALEMMDREEWLQPLPPCVVLYSGKGMRVPLSLAPDYGEVRWTLSLETGEERPGAAQFSELELAAEGAVDGEPRQRRWLWLPEDLPWGYHRVRLDGHGGATCALIVTPGVCWVPGEPAGDREGARTGGTAEGGAKDRFWGVAAQMYLLRSERNWGIGDYTDLRRFVEIVREQGGDAVGVNPLHAMFPDQPEQASPYSPLSRYMLNVLNIDVEAIPEFAAAEAARRLVGTEDFLARVSRARDAKMVAYEDVAQLKLPVLQAVFAEFEKSKDTARQEAFASFEATCDELLSVSCVYAAIRQYMTDQDVAYRDCGRWPEEFRHAASEGVQRFRETHAGLVRYQLWLQWVADEQLGAVKQACEGMAVGMYRDLAVGASPAGAELWSNPEGMVSMAEVGAPPDMLNTAGQNWVLPPFHPRRMKEDGYRAFAALLRTNMRHAGGLRIDHAMALQRLYWIPRGGSPKNGGYVRYPIEDLIGIIALESQRNRCLVVGEDLGTVPKGFRQRMAEARILSYKVLLLEEAPEGKGYVTRAGYQRLALSTASSHDLPTLRGWWEEVDLDLRERLGIADKEARAKARAKRNTDREAMLEMFRDEGLLEGRSWPLTEEFIDAAHGFLARTDAVLIMAQLEDIVEEAEQVNLPGSMPDQYPSWGRRIPVGLEELARDPRLHRLAAIVQRERGESSRAT